MSDELLKQIGAWTVATIIVAALFALYVVIVIVRERHQEKQIERWGKEAIKRHKP